MTDSDETVGPAPTIPEGAGAGPVDGGGATSTDSSNGTATPSTNGGEAADRPPRRRGSRGGRSRPRPAGDGGEDGGDGEATSTPRATPTPRADSRATGTVAKAENRSPRPTRARAVNDERMPDDLPDRHRENKPSAEAASKALVRKPQIGDSLPAPASETPAAEGAETKTTTDGSAARKRRRGGRGRGSGGRGDGAAADRGEGRAAAGTRAGARPNSSGGGSKPRTRGPVVSVPDDAPIELSEETLEQRRGRERNGRAVGRYLMAVHVGPTTEGGGRGVTQIAVLEGRALLEHYVSHPADDVAQIHGNIYLAKVQNVLPGMEAAFVDIGTPKNAVLYRGDTRYDAEDIEEKGSNPRIEQILKARQSILTQVTKNPIAHKGARLTQEISMPGRFVVLIPNSTTYGISKRLPDNERKRLRGILDKVKPKAHGLIVRTAAENVTAEEIERDVLRLARQWEQIEALAAKSQAPALLYREPDMAVRVIREEFNKEYRKVVIDDLTMYEEVRDYVRSISPALEDRVEYYDRTVEPLPLLEKFHVHEQLHKALDRKVWLPSGGSLIIEHTEALTVIDVNTGKNVGTSSLEETVYRNNLEAAIEIARQLRLRDIGGIIVIDFIDMEIRANREDVIRTFRDSLARDKTRTQVFDISDLGLVEMTRKRIGEGLLESFSSRCPECEGRGVLIDQELLGGKSG